MKSNQIVCIREFDYLLDDAEEHYANAQVIPHSAFSYLLKNLHDESSKDELRNFIRLTTYKYRPALQVRNYVGVIQTPCGTQIEILPKLYNKAAKDSDEAARTVLVKMLRTLRDSPFKSLQSADIHDARMPLLEIYIAQFLTALMQVVKQGIRSDYIRVTKNARYLKGRLRLNDQLRKNSLHQERFFVEYQEYQIDRPANRLIKTTLLLIKRMTKSLSNQRKTKELIFAFDGVPECKDVEQDFQKVRLDRAMGYYQKTLAWCKLLLRNRSPTTSAGSFSALSVLYPMERLFEDYVGHCLRRNLQALSEEATAIKTGARRYSLVESHNGKPIFSLQPDFVVQEDQKNILVLDTKWKLIDDANRADKYGISQADMYQLYAYGHKYLSNETQKKLMLIYPKTDTFNHPLATFRYESGFELEVVPFDIDRGKLVSHAESKGVE